MMRSDERNLLGLVLDRQGRYAEAEKQFRTAIALAPGSPHAYVNLGNLLRRQGKIGEAISAYRKAIECDPQSAVAYYNLGNALGESDDPAGAAEAYERALETEPELPDALANLGASLLTLGRTDRALTVLSKAVGLLPDNPTLHAQLGDALQAEGRPAEAAESYRRALSFDRQLARAHYGLGCVQITLGDFAEAVGSFREVLSITPNHMPAQHNLGKALFRMGQADEAIEQLRKAAPADPGGMALTAIAVVVPGSPAATNQTILEDRRKWASAQIPAWPGREISPRLRRNADPLRVGYISGFFHEENYMKPIWGLINHHNRDRFEIHLFSETAESEISKGCIKDPRDMFHHIGRLSNDDVAKRIEESGIDILVDLNGYSRVERLPLFARRPAPIIVAWFNMYATTGMDCFDYLIGDQHVIPAEEESYYSEKIVRVPGSYLTFEVNYPVPEVVPPPCVANGCITFGSLASQYKITPEVVGVWSRILRECPDSRLILKNTALGSAGNRDFVQKLFAGFGISSERLELDGPSEHFTFLQKYGQIDIALDSFPYNGGTTTTEALWQGVPVLTFWGDRWASRTSASILRAAHLGEYVADDLEGYVKQAVELAHCPQTPARLDQLRMGLRERLARSPVCDTAGFARNMENQYVRMWEERV